MVRAVRGVRLSRKAKNRPTRAPRPLYLALPRSSVSPNDLKGSKVELNGAKTTHLARLVAGTRPNAAKRLQKLGIRVYESLHLPLEIHRAVTFLAYTAAAPLFSHTRHYKLWVRRRTAAEAAAKKEKRSSNKEKRSSNNVPRPQSLNDYLLDRYGTDCCRIH